MHVFYFESVDCVSTGNTLLVFVLPLVTTRAWDNPKCFLYYLLKSSFCLRVIGVLGRNVIFFKFCSREGLSQDVSEEDLCVQAVCSSWVNQQCGVHVVAMWTCVFLFLSGKRKALKLNFANPPVKPTSRLPLHPTAPSFQNPHMWVKSARFSVVFFFHFGKQFVLTVRLHKYFRWSLQDPSFYFRTFLLVFCPVGPVFIQSDLVLQRAPANTQHRVVREAEDLAGAALRLHCRRPERPWRDWSWGLWLRQQDGP